MCPFVPALVAFSTAAQLRTRTDGAERGHGLRAAGPTARSGGQPAVACARRRVAACPGPERRLDSLGLRRMIRAVISAPSRPEITMTRISGA